MHRAEVLTGSTLILLFSVYIKIAVSESREGEAGIYGVGQGGWRVRHSAVATPDSRGNNYRRQRSSPLGQPFRSKHDWIQTFPQIKVFAYSDDLLRAIWKNYFSPFFIDYFLGTYYCF